jgi:UDP-glucose 4-epimerase
LDTCNYLDYNNSGFDIFKNKSFDVIIFSAGNASVSNSIKRPIYDLNTNTILLLELLEIIKDNPTKIVFFSSAACLGDPSQKINTPLSPYGVSKLASENYLKTYNRLYSIPVIICRIFSIFGEYNNKQMFYDTVKRFKKDKDNIVIYNPQSVRDFIYVGEVVEIINYLINNSKFNCEVYDIGTGNSITVENITKKIMKLMNITGQVKYDIIKGASDPIQQVSNINSLISLGYNFKYPIDKSIQRTVEWIIKN